MSLNRAHWWILEGIPIGRGRTLPWPRGGWQLRTSDGWYRGKFISMGGWADRVRGSRLPVSSPRRNADSAGRVVREPPVSARRVRRTPTPDAQAGLAGCAAHPPMMTHSHKTLGQHVGEPATEEGLHGQRDDVRAVGAAFKALEPDATGAVISQDPLRAERGAEHISRKVAQHGSSTAGVAHIGHPFAAEDLRVLFQEPGVEFGMVGLQRDLQAVAESCGERHTMEQEVGLLREMQPVAPAIERHRLDEKKSGAAPYVITGSILFGSLLIFLHRLLYSNLSQAYIQRMSRTCIEKTGQ